MGALYHLFVWFAVGPLALSGLLDVVGRQASHSGRVLVVAPELADLMLVVQLAPQVPLQTVVVEMMMMSDEMPEEEISSVLWATGRTSSTKCSHTWHPGGRSGSAH